MTPPLEPAAVLPRPIVTEGDLWSFMRDVLLQGRDIWTNEKSYEHLSALTDARAATLAREVLARLAPAVPPGMALVPMTDLQIAAAFCDGTPLGGNSESFLLGVRAAEAHHSAMLSAADKRTGSSNG